MERKNAGKEVDTSLAHTGSNGKFEGAMIPLRTYPVILLLSVFLFSACRTIEPGPKDDGFYLLVYNVENLFDADGVAVFSDYRFEETENPNPYTPRKLLTKLENITRILQTFNDGRGPEVVLFNELEFDRTPVSRGPVDYTALLEPYRDTTVAEMLTGSFDEQVADLPVEALLWKTLQDAGMEGYAIAVQAPRPIDDTVKAHTNAVFTKFPIRSTRSHPTEDARDILEVVVEVEGSPLYLFNNHWKSGASSKSTEPTRYQNAQVLRARLDEILKDNPRADIILGGDFNSYYNQEFVLDEVTTGINDVLMSQGDELALQQPGGPDLYNLWFELPPEDRYSEIYRSRKSSLMQILVTPGLYDGMGVQYIDQSFGRTILPGENADEPFFRPIRWFFAGESGGGFSDHLPIYARFRPSPENSPAFLRLENPSRTARGPEEGDWINYDYFDLASAPSARTLLGRRDSDRVAEYGRVFEVEGKLVSQDPILVEVGDEVFSVWSEPLSAFISLRETEPGTPLRFFGQFSEHRGRQQFVILDRDWLVAP